MNEQKADDDLIKAIQNGLERILEEIMKEGNQLDTVYTNLKEAIHISLVIEAAENGSITLSDDSIRKLEELLLEILNKTITELKVKIPGVSNT